MKRREFLVGAGALVPAMSESRAQGLSGRFALLIGNTDYPRDSVVFPRLPYAERDANDLAKRLQRLGFNVVERTNLTRERLVSELSAFVDVVARAELSVLYFAGHGTVVGDVNYILPIDTERELFGQAAVRAMGLKLHADVIERLNVGEGSKWVIVDACRTGPDGNRPRGPGQAGMNNPEKDGPRPAQMFITFASEYGTPAYEPSDSSVSSPNGFFAQGLMRALDAGHENLMQVVIETERAVAEQVRTWDARKQQKPITSASFLDMSKVSLRGARSSTGPIAPLAPAPPRAPQASTPVQPPTPTGQRHEVSLVVQFRAEVSDPTNRYYRAIGTPSNAKWPKPGARWWVVAEDSQGNIWPQKTGQVNSYGCAPDQRTFTCKSLPVDAVVSKYPLQVYVLEFDGSAHERFIKRRDQEDVSSFRLEYFPGVRKVSNTCLVTAANEVTCID
jgi:uncharacterized caspase-like protein